MAKNTPPQTSGPKIINQQPKNEIQMNLNLIV